VWSVIKLFLVGNIFSVFREEVTMEPELQISSFLVFCGAPPRILRFSIDPDVGS
jgi:hypothetical protein